MVLAAAVHEMLSWNRAQLGDGIKAFCQSASIEHISAEFKFALVIQVMVAAAMGLVLAEASAEEEIVGIDAKVVIPVHQVVEIVDEEILVILASGAHIPESCGRGAIEFGRLHAIEVAVEQVFAGIHADAETVSEVDLHATRLHVIAEDAEGLVSLVIGVWAIPVSVGPGPIELEDAVEIGQGTPETGFFKRIQAGEILRRGGEEDAPVCLHLAHITRHREILFLATLQFFQHW